jgi:geranylgeranyl diphosphate synthase, type II
LPETERRELESLAAGPLADREAVERLRRLFERAGAFGKASLLVEKYRQRAAAVADEVQPDELRRLFHYLIDVVLRTAS